MVNLDPKAYEKWYRRQTQKNEWSKHIHKCHQITNSIKNASKQSKFIGQKKKRLHSPCNWIWIRQDLRSYGNITVKDNRYNRGSKWVEKVIAPPHIFMKTDITPISDKTGNVWYIMTQSVRSNFHGDQELPQSTWVCLNSMLAPTEYPAHCPEF